MYCSRGELYRFDIISTKSLTAVTDQLLTIVKLEINASCVPW